MNKVFKSCLSITVCTLAAVNLSACDKQYTGRKATFYKFNTIAQITAFDDFSSDARVTAFSSLTDELNSFLNELENSLSTAVEGSCVYRFNQAAAGETVEIDEIAYDVLTIAKSVYELTDGYYNPAVYYSVDLYGFTPTANLSDYPRAFEGSRLPEERYVTAFSELATYFADVEITSSDGEYTVRKPENAKVTVDGKEYSLAIDLGGVGKGYAADFADGLCDKYGFEYGYFDFGSSSMSINQRYDNREGAEYELQMRDPRPSEYGAVYARIAAKNVMLSTSGDYEQYFEEGGLRYCHIIDPTTGSPIRTNIASCTVIGGTAAEDDALSTAISAMGKQRAVEFINAHLSDRIVVFTCDNGDGTLDLITNRPNRVKILLNNYILSNALDENGGIVLRKV